MYTFEESTLDFFFKSVERFEEHYVIKLGKKSKLNYAK